MTSPIERPVVYRHCRFGEMVAREHCRRPAGQDAATEQAPQAKLGIEASQDRGASHPDRTGIQSVDDVDILYPLEAAAELAELEKERDQRERFKWAANERAEQSERRVEELRGLLREAETRIEDAIRFIAVKAGIDEAVYGAMCHEVRSILGERK